MRRWAGVSPRTRRLAPPSAGHSVCAKGLDFRPSASSPTPRAHGELHGGGTAPPPGKRWEQHLTLGARRAAAVGASAPEPSSRRRRGDGQRQTNPGLDVQGKAVLGAEPVLAADAIAGNERRHRRAAVRGGHGMRFIRGRPVTF